MTNPALLQTRGNIIKPAFLVVLGVLFFTMPALAQNVENKIIKQNKLDNPDYAPLGTRMGGFLVFKGLSVSETYDDNIYRDNTNEKSDTITQVKPGILIQSDWNLHSIALGAQANKAFYKKNRSENYTDYTMFITGQLDLDYETYVTATLERIRNHEERGSPEDPDGDEPLQYIVSRSYLSFTRALGYIHAFVAAQLDKIRYSDTDLNGTALDNESRDRDEKSLETKLAYEFRPDTEFFVSVVFRDKDYQLSGPTDRSSTGYDLKSGLDFDITGQLSGNVYGGYLYRQYDRDFEDLDSQFFGTSLNWSISPLTALNFYLDQAVNETIVAGRSSSIVTRRKIDFTHSLLPNLTVTGFAGYDDYDYVGNDSSPDRTDHLFSTGAGLDYNIARGLEMGFRYNYLQRESDFAFDNYNDNRVQFTLTYFH